MSSKIVAGIVAAGMLIAFVSPVVFKLKDISLTAVVLIGLVLMLRDLWEAIKSGED